MGGVSGDVELDSLHAGETVLRTLEGEVRFGRMHWVISDRRNGDMRPLRRFMLDDDADCRLQAVTSMSLLSRSGDVVFGVSSNGRERRGCGRGCGVGVMRNRE